MPLNTQVPAHDTLYMGHTQVIRERITFAKENLIVDFVKGKLPANAIVLPSSGVHIITAFNDSGTDTLDVGFRGGSATDDPDAWATLLLLSAIGFITFDELAAVTNIMQTTECIPTWRYNGQNNDATAGVADIVLCYALAR
jgi:hypothetical protein